MRSRYLEKCFTCTSLWFSIRPVVGTGKHVPPQTGQSDTQSAPSTQYSVIKIGNGA